LGTKFIIAIKKILYNNLKAMEFIEEGLLGSSS
jgi:hypothetical protein